VTRRTIGILDYGVGNLSSVRQSLHALGHRCRISSDPEVLDETDLLVLPGVGAFPAAMENLQRHGLATYLQDKARQERAIIGICLGAQILVDASIEHRMTAGLGLIPGSVRPFSDGSWHIGWNTIEVVCDDPLLRPSDGKSVYFNHSFVLDVPEDYQLCVTRIETPFVSAIRRGRVVGLQFHPEKSQQAGRELLSNVINGLCNA
jgi:imidazole glycerol phosphate synthase glutamine amidotransferase subunit